MPSHLGLLCLTFFLTCSSSNQSLLIESQWFCCCWRTCLTAFLESFYDFLGSWHGLWPGCLDVLLLLPCLCSFLYSCTEFVAGLYSLCLMLQFKTLMWSLTEISQLQECKITRTCDYCNIHFCHLGDACPIRVALKAGTKQVQRGSKLSTVYPCVSSNIRAQMKHFWFLLKGYTAGYTAPAAAVWVERLEHMLSLHCTHLCKFRTSNFNRL